MLEPLTVEGRKARKALRAEAKRRWDARVVEDRRTVAADAQWKAERAKAVEASSTLSLIQKIEENEGLAAQLFATAWAMFIVAAWYLDFIANGSWAFGLAVAGFVAAPLIWFPISAYSWIKADEAVGWPKSSPREYEVHLAQRILEHDECGHETFGVSLECAVCEADRKISLQFPGHTCD